MNQNKKSTSPVSRPVDRNIDLKKSDSRRFLASAGVGFRASFNHGYQDLTAEPVENHAVVADAIAVFIATTVSQFVGKMKRLFLGQVKSYLQNYALLNIPRQLAHVAPGVLGESVVRYNYNPSNFSTVREDTRPESRDASISFQNFGLEYSMLSSRSSSDSTKRLATAVGARRRSLCKLRVDVLVAIENYSNNLLSRLSNNGVDR